MRELAFEVRPSPIEGLGAFAVRPIRKGSRIIEYVGEHVSPSEADRRYKTARGEIPKVLLFSVDEHTVIDGGIGGNQARYINHSCEPNCEAVTVFGHVYVKALRDIAVDEELTYDYHLTRDGLDGDDPNSLYPCHCGAKTCRGTMLEAE